MTKKTPLFLTCVLLSGCASSPPKPDTIYRPRPGGSMDLGTNPNARHCHALTKDFRDAYGLEDTVKTILSIAVAPDHTSMKLRVDNGVSRSSRLIGDAERLRGFWYYDDWTLAVALDHGSCEAEKCPAEIWLIKYNGARTPIERPTKLCFEHWVGTFARVAPWQAPR